MAMIGFYIFFEVGKTIADLKCSAQNVNKESQDDASIHDFNFFCDYVLMYRLFDPYNNLSICIIFETGNVA